MGGGRSNDYDNDFRQLGISGEDIIYTPTKMQILGGKAVAAGMRHSLVLDKDGAVWGFGSLRDGQLGISGEDETVIDRFEEGDNIAIFNPRQIEDLSNNNIAVVCGNYFSLVLKDDGTVWGFGRNDVGQLGNGESWNPVYTPRQIKDFSNNNMAVAAGGKHILVLRIPPTDVEPEREPERERGGRAGEIEG